MAVQLDSRYKEIPQKEFDKEDGHHLNNWRVLWEKGEDLFYRNFIGDKPTKAVAFAKELKRRGFHVEVISTRAAYAPRGESPGYGYIWCPYCIKWRIFEPIIRNTFGTPSAPSDCCPVCYISTRDAYVRKYNPEVITRREIQLELKSRMREASKKKKEERSERGTRARRAIRR